METRRKSLSNLLPRRQSLNNLLPRRKNSQKHHRKSSKAANGDREDDEPPPILGGQIEEIKSTLKLKRKDFIKCWSVFRHHDLNNNGYYTLDEVLNGIVIGEPRTSFVETVFELSDVQDLNRIEYGELFYTIATFCMFEIDEMVKIVFFMFDKNKNGDINKDDMIEFLKILHNESSSHTLKKNIKTALNSFKVKRDGTVGFLPVVHWCRVFPSVMEPAFRLQAKIREKFMGVAFWEKNLVILKKERDCRVDVRERDRAAEERRLLRERKRRIRSELGIQYFFNQRKREHIEKLYPIPIVYFSEDFEVKVKFDDHDE